MASPVPTKKLSAFVVFANAQRPKLKETNPSLSFSEMQQQLSSMWAQLSEDDKLPYKNHVVPASPSPSKFEQPKTPTSTTETSNIQAVRELLPKVAPTPLTHFLASERANASQEFPLLSRLQLNDLLIDRWNKMSSDKKQFYEQYSANAMEKYRSDFKTLTEKFPDFEDDDDSDGGEYSPSDDEDELEDAEMNDFDDSSESEEEGSEEEDEVTMKDMDEDDTPARR